MEFLKRFAPWAVIWAWLVPMAAVATLAPTTPPNVLVHKKTDQILHLIEHKRSVYDHNKAALYAMVNHRIVPYFDFRRMSRWVLARYWRTAKPAQRKAFTTQFTGLMVRTYATALLGYSGQRIAYLPYHENASSHHVVVKTLVVQNSGGANVPIDYRFVHEKTGWKVYDVTIDGVSLVTNYRSVYANKIRRHGLDALIADMKRVNDSNP